MIFEKLPACLPPRYVSVVVNVFCRGSSVRSQSSTLTMELMMVIYRSPALIPPPPPPPGDVDSSPRWSPSVVVLCARFAPSPLDDVSHREGCSNKFWAEGAEDSFYSNVPILGNWVEYRFGQKFFPLFPGTLCTKSG